MTKKLITSRCGILVVTNYFVFSATIILQPKRIMDKFCVGPQTDCECRFKIMNIFDPPYIIRFLKSVVYLVILYIFCLFSNYKSSTEEDHGQVLCWASNGLGEQIQPCVFRVVPLASPAPPKDCRVRSFS